MYIMETTSLFQGFLFYWQNTKSIKLIHAAHAKAAQAIEQHIAPGYEAGQNIYIYIYSSILKLIYFLGVLWELQQTSYRVDLEL
jgi:hypothetical protein